MHEYIYSIIYFARITQNDTHIHIYKQKNKNKCKLFLVNRSLSFITTYTFVVIYVLKRREKTIAFESFL